MNRKLSASRGTDLNNDICVDNIGNRFDLVIVAAIRAKELARQHRNSENPTQLNAPVTALLEIQEGKVGAEYLKRVR
jgi:DNA-directed RNA polymerase omega subunit